MSTDTLNPEKKEEKKGLTNDELRQIVSEKLSLDELPPEKQEEFHNRFVVDEEELPDDVQPPKEGDEEKKGAQEVQEPVREQESQKLATPEEEKPSEQKHEPDLKRKYYEKSNELNTAKQRLEAANKKLEQLETLKLQKPGEYKNTEDVYSEEALKEMREKVIGLEKAISSFTESEASFIKNEKEKLTEQTKTLEEQNLFLSIQTFQGEAPELKTEKPFQVLNASYAKFQDDVGGPEAREKFFSDPEFRKAKEAQGIVFPMDDGTWEKYKTLVEVHHFRNEKQYPDYDSAYYGWRKEKGVTIDKIKEAALRSSQETAKKIVENKLETKTLSPDDGTSSGGSGELSEPQMLAWLEAHPFPKTAEEKKMQASIMDYVNKAGGN